MSSKRPEYNGKNEKTSKSDNTPINTKTNKQIRKTIPWKPNETFVTKIGSVNKSTKVTYHAEGVNETETSLSRDNYNETISVSKRTDNDGFTQVVSRREIAKTKKRGTLEDANLSKKQRRAIFFQKKLFRTSSDINNKSPQEKISKSPKENNSTSSKERISSQIEKIPISLKENKSKSSQEKLSISSKERIYKSPKGKIFISLKEMIYKSSQEKISKSQKKKLSKISNEHKSISEEKQLVQNSKLLVDKKDVPPPKSLPNNMRTTTSYSSALKLDVSTSNHISESDDQICVSNENKSGLDKSVLKLSYICKRDQCTQTDTEELSENIKTNHLPVDPGVEKNYASKSTRTTDTTGNEQDKVKDGSVNKKPKRVKSSVKINVPTNSGKENKTKKSDRKRFHPAKENQSEPIDLINFVGYKKKKPKRKGKKSEEKYGKACKEKSAKPLPRIDNLNFPSLSSSINFDISKKSIKHRDQIINDKGQNKSKTVRYKTNSLSSEYESDSNIQTEQTLDNSQGNLKYDTNLKGVGTNTKSDDQSANECPKPRIRKSHVHKHIYRRKKINFATPIKPDLPTEHIDNKTLKDPEWYEPADWNDLLESDDEMSLDILLHSFPLYNSHNNDLNIEIPEEKYSILFKEKNKELSITREVIQVCLPAKQENIFNSETVEPCGAPETININKSEETDCSQSEKEDDISGTTPKQKKIKARIKPKVDLRHIVNNKRKNIKLLQNIGGSLPNLSLTDDNDDQESFDKDLSTLRDFEDTFPKKPTKTCMDLNEAIEYMEGDHTGYFNYRGCDTPSTKYHNHGSAHCVLETLERIEKVLELMLIQAYKTVEYIPDEFGNQTTPQAVKKTMSEVSDALEPIKDLFTFGESDEPYKVLMNAILEATEPVFNHLNDQRLVLQSPVTYHNYTSNEQLTNLLLCIKHQKEANAPVKTAIDLPQYIQDLIYPTRCRQKLKHYVELNLDLVMNDLIKQEMRITKSQTVTPVILERARILLIHYMNQVTRYYINNNLPPPYSNTFMTNQQKHNARVTPNGLIEFRFSRNMHVLLTVDLGIIVINKEDKMMAAISADGEFCGLKYKYGECAISESGNVIDANVKKVKGDRSEIVRQVKLDHRGVSFHADQSLYTFLLTKNGICTKEFDFCELDEDFLGKFFISNSCIGPKFVQDCVYTLNGAKCEVYPDKTCIWYIQNVKICQFSSGQISVLRDKNSHTLTMWPPHISLRYPPNATVYSGRIKTLDVNVTASATTNKRNRKTHLFIKKGDDTQVYSNDCTFELRNTKLYAGLNLKTGNIYVRTQE